MAFAAINSPFDSMVYVASQPLNAIKLVIYYHADRNGIHPSGCGFDVEFCVFFVLFLGLCCSCFTHLFANLRQSSVRGSIERYRLPMRLF